MIGETVVITNQRRSMYEALAVFVVAWAFLFFTMNRSVNIFDEGIILTDAMLLGQGKMLHRDFYANYGPGSHIVVLALIKSFASAFLAVRAYGTAVMAGIVAAVWLILRPTTSAVIAIVGTSVTTLLVFSSPQYLYPSYPCILLYLIGSIALLDANGLKKHRAVFIAGTTAGLSAYFRYDAGFFILVSHCLGIIMLCRTQRQPWRSIGIRIAVYAAAAAIVFAPAALIFVANAPISAFLFDILEFPSRFYAKTRSLPFPTPIEMLKHPAFSIIYLPLISVILAAVTWWLSRIKPAPGFHKVGPLLMIFGPLALILYYKGLVRVSTVHQMMAIVPAVIITCACAYQWWQHTKIFKALAAAAMLGLIFVSLFNARWLVLEYRATPNHMMGFWLAGASSTLPEGTPFCREPRRTVGMYLPPDYAAASAYLRSVMAPTEKLYVGLRRHDIVYVDADALYFTVDRLPATRWHQFDPGLQNSAPIQEAIIDDLRATQTRWIVRDGGFENIHEPNDSDLSSGVRILDAFIDRHYRRVAAFGSTEIWLQNSVSLPRIAPKPCISA